MKTIYTKHILEMYSNRRNFGNLKKEEITHIVKKKNPICNDEIVIELKIKNKKILNAKFHGISCFVSTISAEALIENITGKKLDFLKNLTKKDIDRFLGINITSNRIKCELLPLEALKKLDK